MAFPEDPGFFSAAVSVGKDDGMLGSMRTPLPKIQKKREILHLTTGLTPAPKDQVVQSLHGQASGESGLLESVLRLLSQEHPSAACFRWAERREGRGRFLILMTNF